MAGLCTGLGLTTDEDGKLMVAGARQQPWPYACTIASQNGLRVDPVTGAAWAPPDFRSDVVGEVGPNKNLVPADTGSTLVQTLTTSQTAPACGKARWLCWILGGYAGWRQGSGNFWAIERAISIEVDGNPVGFTGLQEVSRAEHNAGGGALSSGGPIESFMADGLLEPGEKVEVTASYYLNVSGLTANVLNGLAWRSPRITSTLWRPHP